MGMFDWVCIDDVSILEKWPHKSGGGFQTKNLDNQLDNVIVTKDGQLTRWHYRSVWEDNDNIPRQEEAEFLDRTLELIICHHIENEWFEYKLTFIHGQLESCKLLDYHTTTYKGWPKEYLTTDKDMDHTDA